MNQEKPIPASLLREATTVTPTTRERILDVAFELFVEVGFTGTKITEIENRAGLSGGSGGFYRHFRSKSDLLRPAIERQVDFCMDVIQARQSNEPSLDDGMGSPAGWMQEMLEYMRLFDPIIRFMLADGDRVPEVRKAVSSVLQVLGRQLSWQHNPEFTVCVIALGGYHILSEVQGQPFQGFPQDEFIQVLASMTSGDLQDS